MLFEDKVLYTRRMFRDGVVDEHHRYALRGGPTGWAHVSPRDGTAADVVLICPGGTAHRALDAARLLRARGIAAHVLVPARLYPPDLEPRAAAAGGRPPGRRGGGEHRGRYLGRRDRRPGAREDLGATAGTRHCC
ncbi:hypothetical protein SALBM217S_00519 [Streptomyces griseoloalbus]